VYQVEYAEKAVENSSTALGAEAGDGSVVVVVEKVLPSGLMVDGSTPRLSIVAPHAGIVSSGYLPDVRSVSNTARREAVEYRNNFGCAIPLRMLHSRVAARFHYYTLYSYLRPFGVASLLAGYQEETKRAALFRVDVSGSSAQQRAAVLGKGATAAATDLERLDLTAGTAEERLRDLVRIALRVRDEAASTSGKRTLIEAGWVCEASGWRFERVPADLLAAVEAEQQAIVDAEDDSGDDSDEDLDD
jgi:20S proteasome subunit alpha 7